jgi:hypothetical protein
MNPTELPIELPFAEAVDGENESRQQPFGFCGYFW